MKNISVKEILEITNGELVIGNIELVCENFSKDTRNILENDTYIGIKGETFDGNKFWKEALKSGASAVIVENIDFKNDDLNELEDKTIIKVENTLEALYKIAEYKRSLYNIPVIAITGSVGKTSTKDIIASVVSQKYKTLKTEGNNNNNIGLPFTILKLKDEEAIVLEMGMNHMGEISLLTKIAKPTLSVITNIGTSHIGNLGSRENILKAKLEILEGMENPKIIINDDNDLLHNWKEEAEDKIQIKTYGIENKSNINAKDIILNEENSEFSCMICGSEKKINVPVSGEHFILNSMAAILIGEELSLNEKEIINGIEKFELTKKRMDIYNLKGNIKIINDAYNASFESMKASFKILAEYKNSRKICVLGDMFELGDFAKELHEKVGIELKKQNIDILICAGENAQYIAIKAKEEGMKEEKIYFFKDKNDILECLKKTVKENDVILFKASNGMGFFKLADDLKTYLQ